MRAVISLAVAAILIAITLLAIGLRNGGQAAPFRPPPRHLPPDNAYADYEAAGLYVVKITDQMLESDDLPAIEGLVRANTRPLSLVRQSFRRDCAVPWKPAVPMRHSVRAFRQIGYAFYLEGKGHEIRGEYASAANSYLDAVRLAVETSRDGCESHAKSSMADAERIGLKGLERVVPCLDSGECRSALRRLEQIGRRRTPTSQIIENDRVSILAMLTAPNAGIRPLWIQGYSWSDNLRVALSSSRELRRQIDQSLSDIISRAHMPVYKRQPLPPLPSHPMARDVILIFRRSLVQADRRDTERLLIETMLAVQTYRSSTGRYPSKLDELLPKFVAEAPVDPYTGCPLIYIVTPTGYRLYSAGPDENDDGGKLLNEMKDPPDGDLVVGRLFQPR